MFTHIYIFLCTNNFCFFKQRGAILIKPEEISRGGLHFFLHLPRKPFSYNPLFSLIPVGVPCSDRSPFFLNPNDLLSHVSYIIVLPVASETQRQIEISTVKAKSFME